MSDTNTLAQQLVSFLTPFVPYLVKGGIEAGKAAAGRLGELTTEKVWTTADAIWKKFKKHGDVKQAADAVAKLPDDPDAQATLRLQIRIALAADPTLAAAMEKLMTEVTDEHILMAEGSKSVAIGRDVKDSVIITGNNNKVMKSKP